MSRKINLDGPLKIPKGKIGNPVHSKESDDVLKKLEEFFGYNQTYIHWVSTYCKELGDVPFFLAYTKEGIEKLEKFLEGKLNDEGPKSTGTD